MKHGQMELICLQLDLARQKETLNYIQEYFIRAKEWGYNAVVLYLEGVVRTPFTAFFREEETYSMAEMKRIAEFAKDLDLQLIPAFENLAHLETFLSYSQLEDLAECEDEAQQGRGLCGTKHGDCGCVSNPRLYEVTDQYIAEVASLFDGEYIHMGLDEPFDFAVCDECKRRIMKGESKDELFFKHVMHTYELAKSLGKRMMMWDDFFEYVDVLERLPRDIIMCNWNYSFVGVKPGGHWVNRITKDWFRLYDELGFDYLFCVYAHRASSIYNLQSFTAYANKHHPMGGICTTWCRNDSFYLGAYPFMAYAAKLWRGQIKTEQDGVDVYTDFLGDEQIARLIYSLNVSNMHGSYTDICNTTENEYLLRYAQRATVGYAIERMSGCIGNDVSRDLYGYLYECYLNLRLTAIGNEIFDKIEGGDYDFDDVLRQVSTVEEGYIRLYQNLRSLWEKYRPNVKSRGDSFQKKYDGKVALTKRISNELQNMQESGILYFDTMLHDGYCTVKAELKVKYAGEEKEQVIFNGGIKPTLTEYDAGGCYGFRFRTENRAIEYVLLSVYGEGALYPLHLRYLANGKTFKACAVQKLSGMVFCEENLLADDTRFACLGNDDGAAHFCDVDLSKQKHTVKIIFGR